MSSISSSVTRCTPFELRHAALTGGPFRENRGRRHAAETAALLTTSRQCTKTAEREEEGPRRETGRAFFFLGYGRECAERARSSTMHSEMKRSSAASQTTDARSTTNPA